MWGTRLGFLGRNTIGKHRRRMARKFERIPYKDVSSRILTRPTCWKGTEFTSPVYSYDTQSNASQTPGIADLSGGRGEGKNIPRPTLKKTPCRFRSFGDRHTHTPAKCSKNSDESFDLTYCNALLRMRTTPFGLTGKRTAPGESLPRRERVHRTHGDINLYAETGCLFKPSTSTANGRPKTTP